MIAMQKILPAWLVMYVALAWAAGVAPGREVTTVSAGDLKQRPQQYWADFFVFSDELKEAPGRSTIAVEGRTLFRFKTGTLGTVFAEADIAPVLQKLDAGKEYLFYATVSQRSGGLLSRRGDFVVIVRDVAELQQTSDAEIIRLGTIDESTPVNRITQPLIWLDEIIKGVHKDMFGFAQTQGIPIADVFTKAEYRDRVAVSTRTMLRRLEERERTSGQEFYVNLISSFIAMQYGYAAEASQPEEFEAEEALEAAPVTLNDDSVGEIVAPDPGPVATGPEQTDDLTEEDIIDELLDAPADQLPVMEGWGEVDE